MRFEQSDSPPGLQDDDYSFTLTGSHRQTMTVSSGASSSASKLSSGSLHSLAGEKILESTIPEMRNIFADSKQSVKRSEPRMFGDSVQSSPVNTLGHKSGGSLSSLYQARKANDSATVEQIKQQFQRQIEQMKQASQRHESTASRQQQQSGMVMMVEPPPQFRPSVQQPPRQPSGSKNNFSQASYPVPDAPPPLTTRVSVSISAAGDKIRNTGPGPDSSNIERGKSFLEARSAVQKQIEKMFVDTKEKSDDFPKSSPGIKHVSHGVSHVTPEEEETYNPPPPVHYGVEKALKSLSTSPGSSVSKRSNGDKSMDTEPRMQSFSTRNMMSLSSSNNNNLMSLGNIDISRKRDVGGKNSMDRTKRSSMHEDLILKSAGAALRQEKRVKDEVNLNRRISIHQDKFSDVSNSSFNVSSRSPPSLPLPSPPSLPPPTSASSFRSTTLMASQSEAEYEPISVPPSEASSRPSSSSVKSGGLKGKNSKTIKHRIEYLGAVPLGSKATNLQALQGPIKELYFKNKALQSLGHTNLPGTLEIMETGMKIQYIRELHKGVQEIFNSFPTIAVWAAVKFVHKTVILPTNERRHRFAFCPLISDPDSPEKTRTFYDLDYEEISLAMDSPHPPIFACVMRRAGTPKQLECHGFICQSSEDAIIIAANLYQSLLDTMRKNKASGGAQKKSDHPSDSSLPRQELTRRSIRKSVRRSDPPVRPPRRKRTSQHYEDGQPLVRRKSIRSSTRSIRSNRSTRRSVRYRNGPGPGQMPRNDVVRGSTRRNEIVRGSTRRSSRTRPGHDRGSTVRSSVRYSPNSRPSNNGDLFTKVAIGRTKSFVKTGNQYNLQELFRELKEKEGVDSIDDVLRRVISPDGMSFNDIKPVYRELLLKLAMTMSQDEIFQRSKTIMAASNKKKRKRPPPASNSGSLGSFFKSLSSKSSSKSSTMVSKKTTSTLTSIKEREEPRRQYSSKSSSNGKSLTKADISGPIIMSSVSSPRDDQVDDAYVSCSECGTNYDSVCNYEPCSCRQSKPAVRPRIPTSGHYKKGVDKDEETACEECEDTDSCIESEKCYCSLRGDPRKQAPSRSTNYSSDTGNTTDTTCYSRMSGHVSQCESPQTAWKRNNRNMARQMSPGSVSSVPSCGCSVYSDCSQAAAMTASSRLSRPQLSQLSNDGTLRRRKDSCSGYTSNDSYASHTWLPVHNARNEIRDGRGSSGGSTSSSSSHKSVSSVRSSPRSSSSPSQVSIQNNKSQNSKILLVSAVDPRGPMMYNGPSQKQKPVMTAGEDQQNILSLKKSAEIAALFSGAKINQTTDLVDHDSSFSEHHHRNMSHKLGYFP